MTARLEVVELRQFARDLRRVDRDLARALAAGHRSVARAVAADAQSTARSSFGPHASQAAGISGRGTQSAAFLVLNTGRTPRLLAAEFGAKVHHVFGRVVSAASMRRRVFPPWRGNQWIPGDGPAPGVGYAVNPTVRRWVDSGRLADTYGDDVMRGFASRAFPD